MTFSDITAHPKLFSAASAVRRLFSRVLMNISSAVSGNISYITSEPTSVMPPFVATLPTTSVKLIPLLSISSPVAVIVLSTILTMSSGGISVCFFADRQITSNTDAINPGIQLTSSEPIPISASGSSITFPIIPYRWHRSTSSRSKSCG